MHTLTGECNTIPAWRGTVEQFHVYRHHGILSTDTPPIFTRVYPTMGVPVTATMSPFTGW
jgi:hypothetical protein